jgi:N-acetylmuramoyl-L-alanine amidase
VQRDKTTRDLTMTKSLLLLLPLALFMAGCASGVRDTTRTFRTVVIDAGHGGKDSGATSRRGGAEKNDTLDVAQRLEPKLQAAGFRTVMTRKGDYFVELNDRAAISNRQSNAIFLSIHFNDSPRRRIRGIEVYYNAACAIPLARRLEESLAPLSRSRGVMHANFRVLRRNKYPAVLVECGFLSNPREAARCSTPQFREAVASRLADALAAQRSGT